MLGYTKEKWDSGKDEDWDDLSEGHQEAAKVLGYNKKMWDSDKTPKTEEKGKYSSCFCQDSADSIVPIWNFLSQVCFVLFTSSFRSINCYALNNQ